MPPPHLYTSFSHNLSVDFKETPFFNESKEFIYFFNSFFFGLFFRPVDSARSMPSVYIDSILCLAQRDVFGSVWAAASAVRGEGKCLDSRRLPLVLLQHAQGGGCCTTASTTSVSLGGVHHREESPTSLTSPPVRRHSSRCEIIFTKSFLQVKIKIKQLFLTAN